MLIESQDIVGDQLSKIYNISKEDHLFPQKLKLADVAPIHKKEDATLLKKNTGLSV